MVCDEGEGCSTTSRVADEMEPVDVAEVGFPEDPLRLGVETEIRRRFVLGVNIEILRYRIDSSPEYPEECCVGELRGQDSARQEHNLVSYRHRPELLLVTPLDDPHLDPTADV